MSCELKYNGKSFKSEAALKRYMARQLAIGKIVPQLEERNSMGTASVLPKEEADDLQIVMRFRDKINKLKNMRNNPNMNKFKINEKIEQYQEQLQLYKDSSSISEKLTVLETLAKIDIIEAEKLLENPDALNVTQINNITSSGELWSDIRQFIEVEDLPEELDALQGRAAKIKLQAYDANIKLQIEATRGSKNELRPDDIKLLNDDGFFGVITDIKNSRNKFIRFIGGALERLGIRKNLKIQKMMKYSDELFSKISPSDYDKLFKKDAKGRPMRNHFIYELDQSFFDTRNELNKYVSNFYKDLTKNEIRKVIELSFYDSKVVAFRNARQTLITKGILTAELIDLAVSEANKRASDGSVTDLELVFDGMAAASEKARQNKNNWLADNVVVLNPGAFAKDTTIEERERLINEFKRKVGNDHYAESRIKLAQAKVDDYYLDQKQMREYLEEKHIDDEDAFEEAMTNWEYANNPFIYYDITYNPTALEPGLDIAEIRKNLDYDKLPYIPYAPRSDKGNHYNPAFKELLANENLYNVYTFMNNYMREAVKMLPVDVRNGTTADFVLRGKANMVEAFKANGNRPVDGSGMFIDWASVNHNYEFINQVDELGNPLRKISFAKFQDIDARVLELEDRLEDPALSKEDRDLYTKELKGLNVGYTTDLKATMEMIIRDVEAYRFLSEAADATQLQLYLVNQAKEITGSGYKIRGLETTKMATQYTVDAILYGKYRSEPDQYKKDQFWEDNIFEGGDLVGFTSDKKKKAREIKEKAMLVKPLHDVALEKFKRKAKVDDEELEAFQEYKKYVEEYKALGGKRFSWTKVADSFITFTQLKSLGFSIFSPITNLNFGTASNYIEAAAGQFFTFKTANAALNEMLSTTRNYVRLTSKDKNPKRAKIVNFLQSNNLIFDIMESQYGTGTKVSMDAAFAWMRSSDFFMKGQTIIASMMHDKIDTKTGPKSLWSLIKQDGSIDESQLDDWTEEKRIAMIQKLNALVKRVHGNTDTLSPIWAKKHVLGRLLAQFKLSWIAEGLNTRFGHSRDDEFLGSRVQGRYRELPRMYKQFMALKEGSGAGPLLDQWKHAFENLDSTDQADIRRIAMELAMIASLFILVLSLKMLVGSLDDEEDKHTKHATMFALNMFYRLRQDLTFYSSFETFKDVTRNPIPSVRVITDFSKAIGKTSEVLNPLSDSDDDDVEAMWKNWAKTSPGTRQIYTTQMNFEEELENLNNN